MKTWPDFTFKNYLLFSSVLLFYCMSSEIHATKVELSEHIKAASFMDRMAFSAVAGTLDCAFIIFVIILARRK